MDCSLPGSSVHGITHTRILEWVAISFSRGSSRTRDQTCFPCASPALQVDSLLLNHQESPIYLFLKYFIGVALQCRVSFRCTKKWISRLPWWLSGLELACQCKRHGFYPCSRKLAHAVEQLIMHHDCWAFTLEHGNHSYWALVPELLKPVHSRAHALQQEEPLQWEALASQRRVAPSQPN